MKKARQNFNALYLYGPELASPSVLQIITLKAALCVRCVHTWKECWSCVVWNILWSSSNCLSFFSLRFPLMQWQRKITILTAYQSFTQPHTRPSQQTCYNHNQAQILHLKGTFQVSKGSEPEYWTIVTPNPEKYIL